MDEKPERQKVLEEGVRLTTGDRNKTYGSPDVNLRFQYALWELYREAAQHKHSWAHDAAMQHVFAKIARIACGAPGHRDNYVDAATYVAIAYECDTQQIEPASKPKPKPKPQRYAPTPPIR